MPSVSLPTIAAGAGLAGAGISAAGAYESGQANSAAAAYQAQVAANNAVIAQRNAKTDIQAGEAQAANQGLKTRATLGQQKAAQGAAGVDPNTGSAPLVRAGTQELGMYDALAIRSNAAKQAYSQKVQATSQTAESGLESAESTQASTAGEIGAFGTLLSGASSVGNNWARFQNVGGTIFDPSNWNTSLPAGSFTGV